MIRIVTDSASDFETDKAQELGVISVPLTVSFGEEYLKENTDISREEFYERLIGGSEFPQTSQVTPYEFEQVFREAKEAGDEVIAILLSSGLSGTYQSALIAARTVYGEANEGGEAEGGCYILDSRTASAGEQVLVEQAVEYRNQGYSAREIMKRLHSLRPRVQLVACMNTLEYLYRGGRISRAAAALGTIIHVKPILYVKKDGRPDIIARIHGNQKAITYILEQMKRVEPDERYPVYIMYTHVEEGARRLRKAMSRVGYRVRIRRMVNVGAVIGSHIGPNAYGIVYVKKER